MNQTVLGGPAFYPKEDAQRASIFNKDGGHYNIFRCKPGTEMDLLKGLWPEGEANNLNFIVFSTSGVHGSYLTIEECLKDKLDVTFLVIQPRIVSMTYGNVNVTKENVKYLKKLRSTSQDVFSKIGVK